jgi:succinoglycan biosynthesis protein ExoO
VLISVIIPAYEAQSTIDRAIRSLIGQTWSDWEGIVVCDDGYDYEAFLAGFGVNDKRLRFVSTGKVRSGCHHARNVGLDFARGDYVTQLDADDFFTPERFATLLPLAASCGAAADNLLCKSDETGDVLYRVLGDTKALHLIDADRFFDLSAPLVPLVRRDYVRPRVEGIELAEDVIANLQLLDRLGVMPVTVSSSYVYQIAQGSICHAKGADDRFDKAYASYIDRIESGDGFGLSAEIRPKVSAGLRRKRDLNRAFSQALKKEPQLTFQHFAARHSSAA